MRTPSIYLETTIFNFPFADDAPQYRADTLQLFEEIKAGKFRPFTSRYVLFELEDTKNAPKREKMEALVEDYGIEVLPRSDEIKRLGYMSLLAWCRKNTRRMPLTSQRRQCTASTAS